MSDLKILFSLKTGSNLYGTSTPTSDTDYKSIYLPTLSNMLLGKPLKNKADHTNTTENIKNSQEDVDHEFIPIQVFAQDFLKGQSYALELVYAVDYHAATQQIFNCMFPTFCHELRENFLTSDISALVGYSVGQSVLYSDKGDRLNAATAVKTMLSNFPDHELPMNVHPTLPLLSKLIEDTFPKYVKVSEYAVDNEGTMKPCIKVLEKTLPMNNSITNNLITVNNLIKKFGDRAKKTAKTTADFKATAHSDRILDVGIDLLSGKKLVFPLSPERRTRFGMIRNGLIPINQIREEMHLKLETLKGLELNSTLPKNNAALKSKFDEWLAIWMIRFYEIS